MTDGPGDQDPAPALASSAGAAAAATDVDVRRGLTADEVSQRVADGRVNAVPRALPVRTLGEIVEANVFTWVNAIVGTLFLLLVIAGHAADGLFVGVIVTNSLIGIVQELRARRTLEELEVLNTPKARVRRDGAEQEIAFGDIVADEVLVVSTGDQIAVDGEVIESGGLECDESLLTGEAEPIDKAHGDEVRSGSFVVAGSAVVRATKIGSESYASALAQEARKFQLAPSGLRRDVDKILRWQVIIIPPIAILLLIRQLHVLDNWQDAVRDMVAASIAMVPAGLALLISVAFIVGVLDLARHKVLAKELASVELLARVDTLCLDKTGTITTGEISYGRADVIEGTDEGWLRAALAALVAADPDPNPTLRAIGSAHDKKPDWSIDEVVPFSSARKWAAIRVEGEGAIYLGAPEIVLADQGDDTDDRVARARSQVSEAAERGQRVLLVARSEEWDGERLPGAVWPAGVVVLEDTVRPDAEEILGFFGEQGVTLKVISGDNPRTVAAVARKAGVPGADRYVDARELPDELEALAAEVDDNAVFGRVNPHQKRAMVHAMQGRGHVVGMTGDGVNDVLALKDADMGIAMGSGSAASRAVAQLVLLDNRFATLPVALAQGRRVINNIERVANLFLTKTAYAVTLAVVVAIAGRPFPFLPRQLTLVDLFSIGLPGLVLAIAPTFESVRPGLLRRVLMLSIPAGLIAGLVCFAVYDLVLDHSDTTVDEARTAATFTLLGVALVVLVLASRPLTAWKVALAAAMLASYVAITAIDPLREFFQIDPPTQADLRWRIALAIVLGGVLVVAVRIVTDRIEARRSTADQHRPQSPVSPAATSRGRSPRGGAVDPAATGRGG